jgi:hypothetical protein
LLLWRSAIRQTRAIVIIAAAVVVAVEADITTPVIIRQSRRAVMTHRFKREAMTLPFKKAGMALRFRRTVIPIRARATEAHLSRLLLPHRLHGQHNGVRPMTAKEPLTIARGFYE